MPNAGSNDLIIDSQSVIIVELKTLKITNWTKVALDEPKQITISQYEFIVIHVVSKSFLPMYSLLSIEEQNKQIVDTLLADLFLKSLIDLTTRYKETSVDKYSGLISKRLQHSVY